MSEEPGRRLHPATLVTGFLGALPQTILAIPGVLAFGRDFNLSRILYLAAGIAALTALLSLLRWLRFTYRLGEDALLIESGVLGRRRRVIPFDRIQDVSLEAGPLHRLLGVVRVKVETGGGGGDEGVLDSLGRGEAQRIRAVVRGGGEEQVEAQDTLPLFHMTLRRVLLFGLYNFSLVYLAAIAGLGRFFDDLGPGARAWLERKFDESALAGTDFADGAIVAATIVVVLLLGVVAGVVRTLLREYRFTLKESAGGLVRSRGLLTLSQAAVPLRRVQLGVIDTGWIRERRRWWGLSAQTVSAEGGKAGNQVLAPFAREHELAPLLAILKLPPPSPSGFTAVPKRGLARSGVHLAAVALLVAGPALVEPRLWFALLVWPALLGFAALQRRRHRWRLDGGHLFVRRGLLTRLTYIVPLAKIQTVTLSRAPLQRWLGLATLIVDTAGASAIGGPHLRNLGLEDARALATVLSDGAAGRG